VAILHGGNSPVTLYIYLHCILLGLDCFRV
jgi:hypothetical protein